MDCRPPDSSLYGILQAKILEWTAIPFSRGSSRTEAWTWVSCIVGRFFTVWATRAAIINYVLCLVAQSCLTLSDPMDRSPPGSSVRGNSPGKNSGGGCHVLLQGSFLTQGSNWGLPHCRQILYHLSHQGSPNQLYSNIKKNKKCFSSQPRAQDPRGKRELPLEFSACVTTVQAKIPGKKLKPLVDLGRERKIGAPLGSF